MLETRVKKVQEPVQFDKVLHVIQHIPLLELESVFFVMVNFVRFLVDVMDESTEASVSVVQKIANNSVKTMMAVLLAHVGSTSTLLQDKRCVLMSTTAVHADIVTHVWGSNQKATQGSDGI